VSTYGSKCYILRKMDFFLANTGFSSPLASTLGTSLPLLSYPRVVPLFSASFLRAHMSSLVKSSCDMIRLERLWFDLRGKREFSVAIRFIFGLFCLFGYSEN
jgi:hypothetical protein